MNIIRLCECGRRPEIVERDRATVPLHDQKHNCHWVVCRCGYEAWVYIPSDAPAEYPGYPVPPREIGGLSHVCQAD